MVACLYFFKCWSVAVFRKNLKLQGYLFRVLTVVTILYSSYWVCLLVYGVEQTASVILTLCDMTMYSAVCSVGIAVQTTELTNVILISFSRRSTSVCSVSFTIGSSLSWSLITIPLTSTLRLWFAKGVKRVLLRDITPSALDALPIIRCWLSFQT